MSFSSRTLAGDQPRERLLRLGPGALSDAELVALVAGIEARGRDGVAVSHELIVEVGGEVRPRPTIRGGVQRF